MPHRTARAGRIIAGDGLDAGSWDGFASRASAIAAAVSGEPGCARCSVITAPDSRNAEEIDACCRGPIRRCRPVLDTGHSCSAAETRWSRSPSTPRASGTSTSRTAARHRAARPQRRVGLSQAVGHRIFCELGHGMVPFADVRDALSAPNQAGWIIVGQMFFPASVRQPPARRTATSCGASVSDAELNPTTCTCFAADHRWQWRNGG